MASTASHDFQKLTALLHDAQALVLDLRLGVRDTPPGQFPIHLLPLEMVHDIFIKCLPRECVRADLTQAP